MEKLKLYIVTKSGSDKTFKSGDLIWLSVNGNLNNAMAAGWLSKEEWDVPGTNDFAYEQAKTHYLDVTGGAEVVRKIV